MDVRPPSAPFGLYKRQACRAVAQERVEATMSQWREVGGKNGAGGWEMLSRTSGQRCMAKLLRGSGENEADCASQRTGSGAVK
eukprot:4614776-Pleurochrysis_carterae.AAC.1